MTTDSRDETMEAVVSAHVIDHLANGPATHRDLMDKAREVDAEIARLREALAAANRPPLRIECPDCGDVIVISRVGETVYCQCSGSTWSIQDRKENVDA